MKWVKTLKRWLKILSDGFSLAPKKLEVTTENFDDFVLAKMRDNHFNTVNEVQEEFERLFPDSSTGHGSPAHQAMLTLNHYFHLACKKTKTIRFEVFVDEELNGKCTLAEAEELMSADNGEVETFHIADLA